MAVRTLVNPPDMYAPTAQYTQAIKVTGGSTLFCSGVVGIEPDGTIAKGDVVRQAEVAFENLRRLVEGAGGTLADVVKVTVYVGVPFEPVKSELRAIRARYFTADFPASTLVQVAGFANPDYLFELEATAVLG